ncbi:hypothetical protein BHE74_00044630 [Ensete ventricosum]|nr:hypothetical protein BHE74_00044630 [Ensete ventricosum]
MAVDFDDDVRLAKKEAIVLSTAKMLATSKEKVRNCHWTAEWRTDRAGADCHGRSHDAVEQLQQIEGSHRARR